MAAQLGEMCGRDVVSASGVNEALALIKLGGVDPALLVVDAGQRISREDVERLMEAQRDTPLVLVARALRRGRFDALGERCAAYLVRPVSIGRVTRAVSRALTTF